MKMDEMKQEAVKGKKPKRLCPKCGAVARDMQYGHWRCPACTHEWITEE